MPRRTISMTLRWLAAGALVLAGLAGPLAAPSSAGSPDVAARSEPLAPAAVTGGLKTLYTASWTNRSNATLANAVILVELPAGSSVVATDPAVCTTAGGSDPVVVTCPRDNFVSGATFTQRVLFRPRTVSAEILTTVTSRLRGDEKVSDLDRAHMDTFDTAPQEFRILPQAADAAGSCVQTGDPTLTTRQVLSSANPLITTARLTGPIGGLFCAPVTLSERHRTSPTEACAAGATCSTDISTTLAPAPSTPYQLTFTFIGSNKNMTWYKVGDEPGALAEPVPDCPGATQLPTGYSACVNSRAKPGSMTVVLGVLWAGGPDPSWGG